MPIGSASGSRRPASRRPRNPARATAPSWFRSSQRRAEEVDKTFDRLFPQTREIRAKRVDARGWHAGRAAADRAVFVAGQVENG